MEAWFGGWEGVWGQLGPEYTSGGKTIVNESKQKYFEINNYCIDTNTAILQREEKTFVTLE